MEATKVISGRHYATIGTSFFAMCVIKEFLEDQSDLDQPCINHLKKLLLTQLRKYFEHDTEQLELIKVSIFLQLVLSHRCSSSDTHTSILLPSELSTELIDRQSSVISSKCTKMQFSLRQSAVVHPRRHSPRIPRWPLLFENSQEIRLLLYSIPSGNGPRECQNTFLLCRSRKNYRRTAHLLRKSIMTLRKMGAKTRNMIQWRSDAFINTSSHIYLNYRVSSYVARRPPFHPRVLSAQHLSLDAKNVLVSVQPIFASQCFSRTR